MRRRHNALYASKCCFSIKLNFIKHTKLIIINNMRFLYQNHFRGHTNYEQMYNMYQPNSILKMF